MWGLQKSDFSQVVRENLNSAFCVTYAESSLTCKFELNTAILDFDQFRGLEKSDFSQVVRKNLNSAFCLTYAESSLTCKFELDTAILDLDRFEVSKNPIFHKSTDRTYVVRFVLLTLRGA